MRGGAPLAMAAAVNVAPAVAVGSALLLALPAYAGPDGATLYAEQCAACHQADGSGTVGLAPPLTGDHWLRLGADRGYLPTVLLKGLAGPIQLPGRVFVGSMPAFAGVLKDDEVDALGVHERRLQGASDTAPESSVSSIDEVKALREAPGSPSRSRQRRVQALGS